MTTRLATAALTLASVLVAGGAGAVDRDIAFQANGAGVCQASLPAFEGLIRKRPMAIQNEGGTTAFITCSPVTFQGMESGEGGHGVWLINTTASAVTVDCTAVVGARSSAPDRAVTKQVQIAAGASAPLYWTSSDGFATDNFSSFNTNCALPPGTGIATVYTNQLLDVGN